MIKSTKEGNGVLKKEKGVLRSRMSKEDFGIIKGHSHAILVHFKNQKYVLTSMNAHK